MSQRSPFTHSHQRLGERTLVVETRGYLDEAATRGYLPGLTEAVRALHHAQGRPVRLLFKDGLEGFEPGKVATLHGRWLRELGPSISRVALISRKVSVRFAVAAARLIARVPLELFEDEEQARAWLEAD